MSITKKGANEANSQASGGTDPGTSVIPENAISDSRVRFVIGFMNANLQRRIPLTELASVANLSAPYFCRLFASQTGLSPGEYLRRLRMEKARHLLTTSFLRIKEVMAMVGYDTKSHFARHFKRSFGLTPSDYRNASRVR